MLFTCQHALASSTGRKALAAHQHMLSMRPCAASQRRLTCTTRAASTAAETVAAESIHERSRVDFDFCCPICQSTKFAVQGMPVRNEGLSCPRCARVFSSTPEFIDLTLTSGVQQRVYKRREWGGTELFRSPVISFVYERGWRQGFSWAGFPGVDKEFDMAMRYLAPARGRVVVDMSCGSGLFSRRFARSGAFSGVVAADFSENMLRQAKAFFSEEEAPRSSSTTTTSSSAGAPSQQQQCPITLLRADVGRLPFPTGSVAAIHAGAAIHCWPNPQAALAEISRVLAPGGVFVASTFLVPTAPLGQVLGDEVVRPLNQLSDAALVRNQYRWWEEGELRDLCASVGLQDFERERNFRFILFTARKPGTLGEESPSS